MNVTCETCTHYTPDLTGEVPQGVCRRFPPIPIKTGKDSVTTTFPVTRPDMWCGEHGASPLRTK